MNRRTFLGLTGGTIGAFAGCTSEADDSGQSTTSTPKREPRTPDETCYDDEHGNEYECHNTDATADFDSFYIKAWAADASYREEIDYSNDIDIRFGWYHSGYGSHGVRGHIENTTDEIFDALKLTAMSYYQDDETGEHHTYSQGTDYLFDVHPNTRYPYEVAKHSSFNGKTSLFELWVEQAY